MQDTFAFRADRMPRRKIDPLALKAAVAAALIVAVTGTFARFVIDSERRSLDRVEAIERAREARASAAERSIYVDPEVDAPARSAAEAALAAAAASLARDGSLRSTGTAELSALGTGLIFVDGPSTTDRVVSLAHDRGVWGAAVLGASGTCFYARITAAGVHTFGTGTECTGAAALLATFPSWDV